MIEEIAPIVERHRRQTITRKATLDHGSHSGADSLVGAQTDCEAKGEEVLSYVPATSKKDKPRGSKMSAMQLSCGPDEYLSTRNGGRCCKLCHEGEHHFILAPDLNGSLYLSPQLSLVPSGLVFKAKMQRKD